MTHTILPVVEVIGLPGAGKSTIYQELVLRLGADDRFMGFEEVLAEALQATPRDALLRTVSCMLPPGLRGRWIYRLFSRGSDARNSLAQFLMQQSAFSARVLESAAKSEPPALRTRLASKALAHFSLVEFVSHWATRTGRTAVLDEGLIQLVAVTLAAQADHQDALVDVLDVCPRPRGLIFLRADPTECLRRVRARGKTPDSWPTVVPRPGVGAELWYARAVELLEACVRYFRSEGVEVCVVDGSRSDGLGTLSEVADRLRASALRVSAEGNRDSRT